MLNHVSKLPAGTAHADASSRSGTSSLRSHDPEELLRLALEVSGVGVWEWDLHTQHVKWSQNQFSLFGVKPQEFDNRAETALGCVHPDDRERIKHEFVRAFKQRLPQVHQEFRVLLPDGTVHWIASRARVLYDHNGQAERVTGVDWEFTDRKLTEMLLLRSEQELAEAQRIAQLGTWRWDLTTGVITWSDEIYRIAGLDPELPAPNYEEQRQIYTPESWARRDVVVEKAIKTGEPYEIDLELIRPDGTTRWIITRGEVEAYVNGEVAQLRGTVQDITERKRVEEELFRANQRLQALMDALPVAVAFSNDATCGSVTGNPAMLAQFEVKPGENLSASAVDDNAPARHVRFFSQGRPISPSELPLERAVTENQAIGPIELEVHLPSGRRWFADTYGAPIRDTSENVIGGVAVGVDITDRKHLEEQLRHRVEELEKLMDVTPAAIWVAHDPECRYITGNQMANRFYEAAPGENVSASAPDQASQPRRRYFRDGRELLPEELPMQYAASHGVDVRDAEIDVLLPSGGWRTILGHATPLRDAAGKVRGCIAAFTDVTARKQAEKAEREALEALRQSELRFRALAEMLPQLICVNDSGGKKLYCNMRSREFTGLSEQQILASSWKGMVHPDDLPQTVEKWEHSLHTGKSFEHEHRLRRSDGEYRTFLSRAVPVRNEAGQVERWLGSATDIHELKIAEQTLRRSEKLAVIGRLASTIAHEINNPLMAVTNLLYLIENDCSLSEVARSHVQAAEKELGRVAQIITQTLRFNRVSRKPSDADLRDIINSALELFKPRLDSANIAVERDYQTEAVLNCYPDDLRQVVANLIGNAHDAMRSGGRLRIRVRPGRDRTGAPGVRVSFADTGHGISPELRKQLFQPFFTTKEETGTGLGLWVTSEIVHKHKGEINVRSRSKPPHTGTVFSLFLPFSGMGEASSAPQSGTAA